MRDHVKAFSKRPAANALGVMDEYTRYCLLDVVKEYKDGHLVWWALHHAEFPRLARMARDIFSIPGMSAEVERLFSSVKHMLGPTRAQLAPDGIEASEGIRSWTRAGLILNSFFEYLTKEQARLEAKDSIKSDDKRLDVYRKQN